MNLIKDLTAPQNWLKDKRGDWSFTRIAPAICLLAAFIVWLMGLHYTHLQSYCQQEIDKLLDFAKWAFGAGKVGEEMGAVLSLKKGDSDESKN